MSRSPTTYPCLEHGEVAVPVSELMVAGKVDVFPEITGHGYFDIDFRRGELVLIAKNFIGLIPINPNVSIHVMPRFPVANVLYLVQRAHKLVQYLPGHFRNYEVEPLQSGNPEDVFASNLFHSLTEIERDGLLQRYVPQDIENGWRGRVLMTPTVSRFIAKGIKYQQVRRITERSVDLPENRMFKDTIARVARYFAQFEDPTSNSIGAKSAMLFRMFARVPNMTGGPEVIARNALRYIRGLPGTHRSYERVLWLCYLIATRQGVSIQSFGAARIETMVVNLADVFEAYVRQVIGERIGEVLTGGKLLDGNVHQVRLFTQGNTYHVKPDMYLTKPGEWPVVLDAKYKPKLKSADRYEVIAFCEALQSKLAIFLSPSKPNKTNSEFLGRTASGIEMHEVQIDLAAPDIRGEEDRFLTALKSIVGASRRSS